MRGQELRHDADAWTYRAAVAIATLIPVAWLVPQFQPGRLFNDAYQHASVARNLLAGNGLATSILYYDQHYAIGSLPAPQTVWPPGMSVGAALLADLGVPIHFGLFVLSLIGYATTPAVAAWVLRLVGASRFGQYLAMFGVLCLTANAYYALRGGSDPLLVLGELLVVGGIAMARETVRQRNAGLAVIAIGISLAILMRYTGVFLLVAAGLMLFFDIAVRRAWRELASLIVALAVPGAIFAALVLRNLALVGNVTGGIEPGEAAPVLSVLAGALAAATRATGYGRNTPLGLIVLPTLAIAIIVIIIRGITVVSAVREQSRSSRRFDPLQRVFSFTMLYAIVTCVALVVLALGRGGDAIVERYMMPLLPMLVVTGVALSCPRTDEITRKQSVFTSAFLLTALLLLIVGQFNFARSHIRDLQNDAAIAGIEAALGAEFRSAPLRDCLDGPPTSCRILSSSAQLVGGLTGAEVLGLAPYGYSAHQWTTDEVKRLVDAYRVKYVLLHAADSDARSAPGRSFFADLRSRKVPDWLRLVSSSERIQIFETIGSKSVTGNDGG